MPLTDGLLEPSRSRFKLRSERRRRMSMRTFLRRRRLLHIVILQYWRELGYVSLRPIQHGQHANDLLQRRLTLWNKLAIENNQINDK
jgi:hypothetical protein